jgi:hypothetical protein
VRAVARATHGRGGFAGGPAQRAGRYVPRRPLDLPPHLCAACRRVPRRALLARGREGRPLLAHEHSPAPRRLAHRRAGPSGVPRARRRGRRLYARGLGGPHVRRLRAAHRAGADGARGG